MTQTPDTKNEESYDSNEIKLSLAAIQKAVNVVDLIEDKDKLYAIAKQVITGFDIDEASRADWKSTVDKAMKIAKQTHETKTFPWNNASNIKFPLITRAAIDYASRTMPEIVQAERLVKAKTIGKISQEDKPPVQPPMMNTTQMGSMGSPPVQPNPAVTGLPPVPGASPQGAPETAPNPAPPPELMSAKERRAKRVTDFMSYQLLSSPDWEDNMDKLLQILPILGTAFKKTYYDEADKRVKSELCVPDKIVVNYGAQSLESARRITHVVTLYKNDIIERQRKGIYCGEFEVETLNTNVAVAASEDEDFPIDVLEQHCWLDLDGDDYCEPYIVTVHKESTTVLRIVPRFDKIERKSGQVLCITPIHYFTDYHFIRSPDGGFYSMGFGSLLLPLNKAINSLINQLIDSGTLSNVQGGFLGRGLRLRSGEFSFKMGEWKVLDSVGQAKLSDNIYQLPVREPSGTLYQLLGLLMQIGKDLTSSTDALQGTQAAQNVSTGTLGQLIEQGTKMFTAINKRVYRSLKKEYQKIYTLDYEYLTQKEYAEVLDDEEADVKKDFEPTSLDIMPVADPSLSSDQQRLSRMSVIQQLQAVDKREADRLVLISLGLDSTVIERLLPPQDPNPPPSPDAQETMAKASKLQADVALMSAQATLAVEANKLEMMKIQQANKESDSRIQEAMARVWKMQNDAMFSMKKLQITDKKMQMEEQIKSANTANQAMAATANFQVAKEAIAQKAQQAAVSNAIKATEVKHKVMLEGLKQATEEALTGDTEEGLPNMNTDTPPEGEDE